MRFRLLVNTVAIFFVGLIVVELILYTPPIRHQVTTLGVAVQAVTATSSSTTLDVKISHGAGDQELQLVAFPVSGPVLQPSIFIFNDPAFPVAGATPRSVQGVFDHLMGELSIRQYANPIVALTGNDLRNVLKATDLASRRLIVDMTGVLPAEVFSRTIDLVSPWVKAGGLMVWGGGAIGYFSGIQGHPLSQSASAIGPSLRERGPAVLLGNGLIQFPNVNQRIADQPSAFGSALHIAYQLASAGVDWHAAVAQGGQVLGSTVGPFSSVTYLPRGRGGYLLFGGEILDEESVAQDLARLLLSGAAYAQGPVAARQVHLPDLPQSSVVTLDLPFVGNRRLEFFAFDPSPDGVFSYTQELGP